LRPGELDLLLAPFQASRDQNLVEEYLFEDEFVVYASTSHRGGDAAVNGHSFGQMTVLP